MYVYILTYVGASNLRIAVVTNTTVTIQWNPANSPSGCGPVLYYIVTITSLIDTKNRNPIVVWGPTAEFSDLINGIDYSISVVAVNRAGTGSSSMITVTTLTGNEGKIIMFNVHKLYYHIYICPWLRGGLEASKH